MVPLLFRLLYFLDFGVCLLRNIVYTGMEYFCSLIRGSLFIELGCLRDLGKGWRGDLGTFMISRPI